MRSVQRFFTATEAIAPGTGARIAERMWFTPPRYRSRDAQLREAAWLEPTEGFLFEDHLNTLQGFSAGSGSTVLLVHGWGGRAAQLGGFIGPLLNAGFRVVGVDLPAHGDHPARSTDLFQLADTLCRLIATIEGDVFVVAHSLGAGAVELAATQVDTIRGAVYLAPGLEADFAITTFVGRVGGGKRLESHLRRRLKQRFGPAAWKIIERRRTPLSTMPILVLHDPLDRETHFELSRLVARASSVVELRAADAVGHFRILRDQTVIGDAVQYLEDVRSLTSPAPKVAHH